MRYDDLMNILEARARRLGIGVDAADLELAMQSVLQTWADTWDLDGLIVSNDRMFVTREGQERYPLPSDFGRPLHFLSTSHGDTLESWLRLSDGSSESDLQYLPPIDFERTFRDASNGRPDSFTFEGNAIRLTPPPDDNGGSDYTGRGIYVKAIKSPDPEDEVPLQEPSALIAATLFEVAADLGSERAGSLQRERDRQMSAMVNNQHRKRQQLYTKRVHMRARGIG